MKILLHEYAGYSFPIQLARALAERGNEVILAYFEGLYGPVRNLGTLPHDPINLRFYPIGIDAAHRQLDFFARRFQERKYGAKLASLIEKEAPDIVLLSNTPLDVLEILRKRVNRRVKMIWWLQDVFSVGIGPVLQKKYGPLGGAIGSIYRKYERAFARRSDHIVAISADFIDQLKKYGVREHHITVIENWTPLAEVTPLPRENLWKQELGLCGKKLLLYSGTLGFKHDPTVLIELAQQLSRIGRDDVRVVVVSEGMGARQLRVENKSRRLSNLVLLPWQPYHRLSEVLSAADILMATIEKTGAKFSVPSKVLSYLCAGRPLVAAIPSSNLAAKIIREANAGVVVEPDDVTGFCAATIELLDNAPLRALFGSNARKYAEANFEIERKLRQFLDVMNPLAPECGPTAMP